MSRRFDPGIQALLAPISAFTRVRYADGGNILEKLLGAEARVTDPDSIYFFRDHLTFLGQTITPGGAPPALLQVADQLRIKQEQFALRQGIRLHGELSGGRSGSEAICHSKILQSYAMPGQLIIGSDSHAPHSGAVGCVAFESAPLTYSIPGLPKTSACGCPSLFSSASEEHAPRMSLPKTSCSKYSGSHTSETAKPLGRSSNTGEA